MENLGKDLLAKTRRRSVGDQPLVKERPLFEDRKLPLLIEPAMSGVDLMSWAGKHREELAAKLLEHGGILFRGFGLDGVETFEKLIEVISERPLEYKERSSPRHAVSGNIYTSTDYPPEHEIFLHNENSYQSKFPQKIFFYCVTASETGGETPIADCRRIYQRLSPEIRDRFAEHGWMYQRNFGDGFGLPWQTVFQTEDKDAVEAHCAKSGITCQWRDGDRLRTQAVRPTMAKHPQSGEMTWFNHATFFHYTTLDPMIQEMLLMEFGEEDLPTNTYYGDGTPIEKETLEELRALYGEEKVLFPWQEGDVLMLDNLLTAHGRSSFTGNRKVVVGMAEPRGWDEVAV